MGAAPRTSVEASGLFADDRKRLMGFIRESADIVQAEKENVGSEANNYV